MRKLKSFLLVCTLPLLTIYSCNDSDRDMDNETEGAQVLWVITNQFNHIIRSVHNGAVVDSVLNNVDSADVIPPEICADSITRVPNLGPYPINMQIDYEPERICAGGFKRSGSILATLSAKYASMGSTITIQTIDYMVEDLQINGNITMQVTASNSSSTTFKVTWTDGSIIDTRRSANNITIIEGEYEFTWNAGQNTVTALDDNFTISGSGNGVSWSGINYDYTIDTPLTLKGNCLYENTGVMTLKAENRLDRICELNTYNGACDNLMLVTIPTVLEKEEVRIP